MFKYIIIFVLFTISHTFAQGIFDEVVKTAKVFNDIILDVTALTPQEENQIGKEVSKQIEKDKKIIKEYKFDIQKIFTKLKKYIKRKEINYHYKVVKDDIVNAYTIIGGAIYINSALIDMCSSEDELASVLAHEIAHNELKHCAKRVQLEVQASKIDPNLGNVVGIAYQTLTLPFSKYEEFDADEYGVNLMKKAGFNKQGAITFFEKLYENEKKNGLDKRDPVNDFIASHPLTKERIEKIKKM